MTFVVYSLILSLNGLAEFLESQRDNLQSWQQTDRFVFHYGIIIYVRRLNEYHFRIGIIVITQSKSMTRVKTRSNNSKYQIPKIGEQKALL